MVDRSQFRALSLTQRHFPTARAIWRGEVPLFRMIFLYLFVGTLGLSIPINSIRALGHQPAGGFWVVYSLGLIAYVCFICIGTWKAADDHEGSMIIPLMTKFTILVIYIVMGSGFLFGLFQSSSGV